MTEQISNKELARNLRKVMKESLVYQSDDLIELIAERLAAMPDVGEQEPFAYVVKGRYDNRGSIHDFLYLKDSPMLEGHIENNDEVIPLYTQPQQPAPDKATIKRYCLEFYRFADQYVGFDLRQVFEEWWQQQSAEGETNSDPYPGCERECGGLGQPCLCWIEDQISAEGGEWYGKPDRNHESWCQLDEPEGES